MTRRMSPEIAQVRWQPGKSALICRATVVAYRQSPLEPSCPSKILVITPHPMLWAGQGKPMAFLQYPKGDVEPIAARNSPDHSAKPIQFDVVGCANRIA